MRDSNRAHQISEDCICNHEKNIIEKLTTKIKQQMGYNMLT